MRKKALDKEHVDDDNDRHMIKSMHVFYMHRAHKYALLCQLPEWIFSLCVSRVKEKRMNVRNQNKFAKFVFIRIKMLRETK